MWMFSAASVCQFVCPHDNFRTIKRIGRWNLAVRCAVQQELITRWDSERELFYDDIVHMQASAYAHWTDFLISTINIYAIGVIYAHNQSSMHLRPSNRVISLFCSNNRWIIAQIVLIWSQTKIIGGIIFGHRLSKVDFDTEVGAQCWTMLTTVATVNMSLQNKNSSADEIANVTFLRRHRTCRGQRLRPLNRLPNYTTTKYIC